MVSMGGGGGEGGERGEREKTFKWRSLQERSKAFHIGNSFASNFPH